MKKNDLSGFKYLNHSKSTNFKMPREPRKRGKGKKDKKKYSNGSSL